MRKLDQSSRLFFFQNMYLKISLQNLLLRCFVFGQKIHTYPSKLLRVRARNARSLAAFCKCIALSKVRTTYILFNAFGKIDLEHTGFRRQRAQCAFPVKQFEMRVAARFGVREASPIRLQLYIAEDLRAEVRFLRGNSSVIGRADTHHLVS